MGVSSPEYDQSLWIFEWVPSGGLAHDGGKAFEYTRWVACIPRHRNVWPYKIESGTRVVLVCRKCGGNWRRTTSIEHAEQYLLSKIKRQLRAETSTMQTYDEWREQKPTYAVPREGILTTARDPDPPICYGVAHLRVRDNIRLESVIPSESKD